MPANLENSAVATGLQKVSFHSNPKERQIQRMLKLLHNCTHFTCSKTILKILQARLQQYVNQELPNAQTGFRKGSSVQFSSEAQSCPTLCDPMNCSTPGLPVHHHLLEFTQTHVHRVRDAIQPSHPRSSPYPPAPNPSQHQSIYQ